MPGFGAGSPRPDRADPARRCAASVAILNGTLAGAVGLGLQLWLAGILIWAVGHIAAVWAAKRDPLFIEVARRHLRIPGHLSV